MAGAGAQAVGVGDSPTLDLSNASGLPAATLSSAGSMTPNHMHGLNQTASSGHISGGEVTRATGLTVDVAAGEGCVVDLVTGPAKLEWGAVAGLSLTANAKNYVYVTSGGVVSASTVGPAYDTNVRLAVAWTSGAGVLMLSAYRITLPQFRQQHHSRVEHTIGPLHDNGLAVTEVGAPSLQFAVDSGVFWVHDMEITVSASASPAPFRYWYRDGAGSWTVSASEITSLNDALYDDGSGTLAALTAGYWRKDLLFTVGHDGSPNVEYHVVYGQEEHATQGAAEAGDIPAAPDILLVRGLRTASFVLQKGSGDITTILDERPRLGQLASQAASVSDHGLLGGLGDDDHAQYLMLSGGAARNALTGTLDAANGTVRLPAAAVPAQTAEGSVVWDTNDDVLTIGTGAGRKALVNGDDSRLTDSRPPSGSAGGGLGGSYPNPDVNGLTGGSLSDDAAHGARGGGTQHALAVAGGAAGFLSGTDKSKLDSQSGTNTGDNVQGTTSVSGIYEQATSAELLANPNTDTTRVPRVQDLGGQVTSAERTAGTQTAVRLFSPADIASMAGTHGGGGAGEGPQWVPVYRQNEDVKNFSGGTYVAGANYLFPGTGVWTPTVIQAVGYVSGGTAGKIRVYDVTNAKVICERTGISNTTKAVLSLGTISNLPAGQAIWEIQGGNDGAQVTSCAGVNFK